MENAKTTVINVIKTVINLDMHITYIWYDVFVNCNWVDTRWHQYSTHLHTNNTQNDTINLGSMPSLRRLCELYPGICLATEEKTRKKLSQGNTSVINNYVLTIIETKNVNL